MASSPPDSVPQRRLRSSSAHQRSMTPSRFSSPPPPTPPPAKRRRLSQSTIATAAVAQPTDAGLNNGEGKEGDDASLTPCRVRRTYICKVCTFASINPRQFLLHQKDFHGLKQNIRECPYCMYATIYSHKLVRHITLVHKPTTQRTPKMATRSEPPSPPPPPAKSPSPPKLVPNVVNPMYPGSISPSTLPPPSVAPKLVPSRTTTTTTTAATTTTMVLPPELEVIPVSESRLNSQKGGSGGNSSQTRGSRPSMVLLSRDNRSSSSQSLQGFSDALAGVFSKSPAAKKSVSSSSADVNIESCAFCSFKSMSRSLVERHEKVTHFKKKFFRCNKCTYITNVRSRYTKHVRYHTMPYIKCELCDFSTPYKWNLDRHRRNHIDGTDMTDEPNGSHMYRCHLCTFHTLTKQSLSGHLMNHHAEGGGRRRRRPIEEGGFYSEPEFGKSSGMMEGDEEEEEDDGYDFDDDEEEDDDEEGEEEDDDDDEEDEEDENDGEEEMMEDEEEEDNKKQEAENGMVRCMKCKSMPIFNTMESLSRHYVKVHRMPGIPNDNSSVVAVSNTPGLIKCDLCPYTAKWVSEVIRHRRVHVTDKPFECTKCQFSSRWKGDLTRHVTKFHPERGAEKEGLVENIDQLLDQSMMIGGAEELQVYNQDREAAARAKRKTDAAVPEIDYRVLGELIKGQGMKQQITAPVQLSASVQLIPTNPQLPPPAAAAAATTETETGDGPIIRKKYQCPRCSHLMTTTVGFNSHMQSHVKAFQCSECSYKGTECDVMRHLKRTADGKHQAATVVRIKPTATVTAPTAENYEKFAVYETVTQQKKTPEGKADGSPEGAKKGNKRGVPRVSAPMAKLGPNIIFKCKYCQFRDPNRRTILRHLQVHTTNKPFWCGICGQSSNSKNTILRHCQVRHNVSGPIIQRDAPSIQSSKTPGRGGRGGGDKAGEGKAGATADEDQGFVIVDTSQDQSNGVKSPNSATDVSPGNNSKPEVKSSGPSSSSSSLNLWSKDDKRHQCSICPYRCRKMFDLRIHSYMHKPHKGADYKCSYCPFYVSLKGSLMNHMKLHTETQADYQPPPVAQTVSPKQTETAAQQPSEAENTKRQMNETSSSSVKRFCCEQCPYSTNSHTTYFYHRQFHRPSKHGIFKCGTCTYSVSRLHLLHQHERVHAEEHAITNASATEEDRSRHMDDVIESTISAAGASPTQEGQSTASSSPPPTTAAAPPPGSTTTPAATKASKRQVTMETLPTLPRVWVHRDGVFKKMFKCRHCPHVSKKRTVIFEHEKMHTLRDSPGSKANYHCQYCNYSCMNGGILTSHMRVHKAQNSTNFYINDNLDAGGSTSGAGRSRWTSTPKATARKGLSRMKQADLESDEKAEEHETNLEQQQQQAYSSSQPQQKLQTYHECDYCPARFYRNDKKMNHMKCHGTQLRYKCSHCCYSAKHRPHLLRHAIVHTEEYKNTALFHNSVAAVPKINTQTGSASLTNLSQISPGGSSSGIPEGRAYTCTQCPAVFLKESTLLYHLKMHDGNAKYKCDHCTYSVFNYSNLVRHARVHGIELPSEPPDLSNTMRSDSSLSEAKKAEIEEETATFKCPKCPAVFDKKLSYDVHAGLHGSRQWFKCDRCDYSVKYEANLIRHRHLHDVHDEGKAVTASFNLSGSSQGEMNAIICSPEIQPDDNQSLMSRQKMQEDEKRGEDRRDEEESGEVKKLFQCPKCPYTHLRKDAVQSHLRRHTSGTSEARCPHCDYGSNMQSFLREHIKLHFDPHRLRQVEAFAHWEELEVWVRSGNHKTLIYRYALGEKLFTENDCRTESIAGSLNLTKENIAKSIAEEMAVAEDESNAEEKENTSSNNNDETMDDDEEEDEDAEEEEEEVEETAEEAEKEQESPSVEQESVETNTDEATTEESPASPPKTVTKKDDEEELDDEVEEESVLVPDLGVEEKKDDKEEVVEKSENLDKQDSDVVCNETVEKSEEKVEVAETTEQPTVEAEVEEQKIAPVVEETVAEVAESVEVSSKVEAVEKVVSSPMEVEEVDVDVEEDEKVDVEKMETSEEEIVVHDECPGEEQGAAAAALRAMTAMEEGAAADEAVVPADHAMSTEEVIEEGTVSMDDMIASDELTLSETCTPV